MCYVARQIPYAIGQFTVNEFCHELALRNMSEERKRSLSGLSKFTVSLGSGIVAGFAAAVLSHVWICLRIIRIRLAKLPFSRRIPCYRRLTKGMGPKAP